MSILDKAFDVICFVIGPLLFIVGFFDGFRHQVTTAEELVSAYAAGRTLSHTFFYLTNGDFALIISGAGLICLGLVIRSWKK
jgi:hypothetical protein